MSLSINPLAQLIAAASAAVTRATSEAQLPVVGDAASKAKLDATVSRLSGELGSGLNGMSGAAGTAIAGMKTQLSGLGNQVQSFVGGANLDSLTSAARVTANGAADIQGTLNKLTGGSLAGGLQGLAGSISKGAGMLNNILSLKRGANLPAAGELILQTGAVTKLSPGAKDDWRVRVSTNWSVFDSPMFALLERTGGVVWPYMPNISVKTKANYNPVEATHSNYSFYSYKNSVVEDIDISGEFSCETEEDAAYWIAATTFFKTATKMFFGQSSQAGNPPIICNLSGYGASVFDKVPVIIKSFSVDLKDDVNYIRCNEPFGTNTWVPVMSTISITVSPIYNRARLRQFDLKQYAAGKMTQGNDGVGFI